MVDPSPLPLSTERMECDDNNLNQKTSMELFEDSTSKLKVTYDYFKNGWLKEVSRGTTPTSVAAYTYDAVGNRTKIEYGNPTYTVFSYDSDPRYRIEGITHWIEDTPEDTELLVLEYTRDGAGNPLTMDDGDPTEYDYDENSRLTDVTYPDDEEVAFGYDWVGNRLNPPAAPNPMAYNSADQLTRWPEHHQYEYLDTGSLYEQYDDDDPRVLEKTYSYSSANLLTKVVHGDDPENDPASEMTWDADGNRVSFTRSTGGTWEFVYDPTAGIPAVVEEYDGSASVYYIREPGGELIARMSGENVSYYHFDALGSTRMLTDSSGTETDSYTYDAWGQQTAHTGSTAQPYRFVGQLGYYSHYQDAQLFSEGGWQLLQVGLRFLDTQLGRFTQADPQDVEGDYSRYAYANNNPAQYVDPKGTEAVPPGPPPKDWTVCQDEYTACMKRVKEKNRECLMKWGLLGAGSAVLGGGWFCWGGKLCDCAKSWARYIGLGVGAVGVGVSIAGLCQCEKDKKKNLEACQRTYLACVKQYIDYWEHDQPADYPVALGIYNDVKNELEDKHCPGKARWE